MAQQKDVPLAHYSAAFRKLVPESAIERTGIPFDGTLQRFTVDVSGHLLYAQWPEFKLLPDDAGACPKTLYGFQMQVLTMRFLLEGAYVPPTGVFKAYRELPWGDVYDANFRGNCIRRLASGFGNRPDVFAKAAAALGGIRREAGDISYDLPFMGGVVCRLILWGADDEFPPSAQFLFSDNTPAAFNAEDLAVVGDVIIRALTEVI